jgi:hypothetical protein
MLAARARWIRGHETGLVRWLRVRPPLMPIIVFLLLVWQGINFQWQAGIFYALRRMVAEAVLPSWCWKKVRVKMANNTVNLVVPGFR